MTIRVVRNLDYLGNGPVLKSDLQRSREIDPSQTQNQVGLANRFDSRSRNTQPRRADMERMAGGKRCAGLDIRQDLRIEYFREPDAIVPIFLTARAAAHQDHRTPRPRQKLRDLREAVGRRLRNRARLIARRIRQSDLATQLRVLPLDPQT